MAESVHILLGGVPFAGEVVHPRSAWPGLAVVRLLEEVGREGEITGDEATTYYPAGTLCVVAGAERHPTTRQRQCRLADPSAPSSVPRSRSA